MVIHDSEDLGVPHDFGNLHLRWWLKLTIIQYFFGGMGWNQQPEKVWQKIWAGETNIWFVGFFLRKDTCGVFKVVVGSQ